MRSPRHPTEARRGGQDRPRDPSPTSPGSLAESVGDLGAAVALLVVNESEQRLAVYGSLAPGRQNHHVVAHLPGRWLAGTVRGWLRYEGWGADLGFPGIVLDRQGPHVGVHILESSGLLAVWSGLDEFEGPGYRRIATVASTAEGDLCAQIYELVPTELAPTTGSNP